LFALFFLLAVLVLTRSMFHPLLMLLVPLLIFVVFKDGRRKIVTAALVPLLVVGLWMAKNYYTVGSLSTSSLLGMNLSKITIMQLPGDERTRMYQTGEMSVIGLYSPFMDLDYYRRHAVILPEYHSTGIPVMDNERTSSGKPN
jgi:hypothetical protein